MISPSEYIVMILLAALFGIALFIPIIALASHLVALYGEYQEQRWMRRLKKRQKELQRKR